MVINLAIVHMNDGGDFLSAKRRYPNTRFNSKHMYTNDMSASGSLDVFSSKFLIGGHTIITHRVISRSTI